MLDHDKLAELAKNNPDAFEKLRLEILETEIIRLSEGDPEKLEKYKLLQDQIDQELSKYTDPAERYDAMSTIFFNKMDEFKKVLATQTVLVEAKQNADILTFPKK